MEKIKILLVFLLMIFIGCQQDELTIYRYKHDEVRIESPKTYIASENRQCPKCDKNEYCNTSTGRCEAKAQAPETKQPTKNETKPASNELKPRVVGDIFLVDKIGTYDPRYDIVPTYPKY